MSLAPDMLRHDTENDAHCDISIAVLGQVNRVSHLAEEVEIGCHFLADLIRSRGVSSPDQALFSAEVLSVAIDQGNNIGFLGVVATDGIGQGNQSLVDLIHFRIAGRPIFDPVQCPHHAVTLRQGGSPLGMIEPPAHRSCKRRIAHFGS